MKLESLQLETGYLLEPIALHDGLQIHQIQITAIAREGSPCVEISMNPNRCTLDSFGEPKVWTRMAQIRFEATLELLEECDGKQLFALKPAGQGPVMRLSVLPPCFAWQAPVGRLLIFGDSGELKVLLPLQFTPAGCVAM
jgi:hypothetical protein